MKTIPLLSLLVFTPWIGAGLLAVLRRSFPKNVLYAYVRQPEPLGLGHAILCAKEFVGDEPFAVLLGDDSIDAETARRRADIVVFLVGHRQFRRLDKKLFLDKIVVDAAGLMSRD